MASELDFAVVICPGAFHTPAHFTPLVQALQAKGIQAVAADLPTMKVSDANPHDLSGLICQPPAAGWPTGFTDADLVKSEIRSLAESGKKVILVGHSYGGWLATESAAPDLRFSHRKDAGQKGGVVGIFYISGHILPKGQSVDGFWSPEGDTTPPPPFVRLHDPSERELKKGLVMPYDGEQYFFGDLPPDEAKVWASKLRAQPIIKSPLSQASYIELPCAYLHSTEDKAFPTFAQELMVKSAREQGGQMSTYTCAASHSPFLSWTEGTANCIADFASKL